MPDVTFRYNSLYKQRVPHIRRFQVMKVRLQLLFLKLFR